MKQFASFIRKEIFHIVRDPFTLSIMLILPVILLIILGYAVSTEVRNTPFIVFDESKSTASQELIAKIDGNAYFTLSEYVTSGNDVERAFQQGKGKIAVIIPQSFGNDLLHRETADIQVLADASDPNEASTLVNYMQLLIVDYQRELSVNSGNKQIVNTEVKMLYNPQMKSMYNIVPGMIGMLMMLICALMTSISVVREKELGTMEILLVSPLRPATIILAKAVPYLFVALMDVGLVMLIAHFILGVPIEGSILLIFLLSIVYTFSALALGLLISTIVETQQAAMIISGLGLLLPSMLLSNMIFPVDGMPLILQIISYFIPARWFTEALRNVMIKGLGFEAIWMQFLILLIMGVSLLTISIKKFKNRL